MTRTDLQGRRPSGKGQPPTYTRHSPFTSEVGLKARLPLEEGSSTGTSEPAPRAQAGRAHGCRHGGPLWAPRGADGTEVGTLSPALFKGQLCDVPETRKLSENR